MLLVVWIETPKYSLRRLEMIFKSLKRNDKSNSKMFHFYKETYNFEPLPTRFILWTFKML